MSRAPAAAQRGMTLVELILFIVIAAVVAAAMVQAFSGTMRGSNLGKQVTHATQLGQERMEVILGQRKRLGYAGFTALTYDPCQLAIAPWPASQPCTASSYAAGDFVVQSTLSAADACGTGCREITVAVTDPYGDVLTRLTEQVWDY